MATVMGFVIVAARRNAPVTYFRGHRDDGEGDGEASTY